MVATSADLTVFDSLVCDKIQVLAKMPQQQHNDNFFLKKWTYNKVPNAQFYPEDLLAHLGEWEICPVTVAC